MSTTMNTTQTYAARLLKAALCFTILIGSCLISFAQEEGNPGITVYQYRQVPQDKIEEFIKRETTYWSKIAEKGFEKGNITFWAVLQKVGGYDIQNSSNFLFVNTYKDIDNMGSVWNASEVFPDVPMEQMETNSMSKVTSVLFLESGGWFSAADAKPDDDFKYLKMIYHQTASPGAFVAAEIEHWGPFIQSAMDKDLTSQVGWGSSTILSPSGPEMKFSTVSVDMYPNLKEALSPRWDNSVQFPEGLSTIMEMETGPRGSVVYRVVKAMSANDE